MSPLALDPLALDPLAQALRPEWVPLLQSLTALGPLAVEVPSHASGAEIRVLPFGFRWEEGQARFQTAGSEVRLFPHTWATAMARPGSPSRLECFDWNGDVVLRVDLPIRPEGLEDAESFLEAWAQDSGADRRALNRPRVLSSATSIDRSQFLRAWEELPDPQAFPFLLARFGLKRRDALRLAEGRFTEPLPRADALLFLEMAQARRLSLEVLVGNRGCLLCTSGPVEAFRREGARAYATVADTRLRLELDRLDRAWLVLKPGPRGPVTSLEVFDRHGDLALQCIGGRNAPASGRVAWRLLFQDLGCRL
ncbi:MAG: hypothetical protein HYZ13_00260 [Acidobacteria bacterium]|nr:hypothetical protein [Acidobacteriota bacterium]